MSDTKRDVLVSVSGLTPQIVTETLWALVKNTDPPFVPDEIVIITTQAGARLLDERLLGPDGALRRFCDEFGVEPVPELRVVSIEEDDIRLVEESIHLANTVVQIIRDLTADPATRVHASLAGGRKTMSFYLGYAMSLFGRPQDALSHVLVAPAFETLPDFFYIPRQSVTLKGRDGKPVDTREAYIDLVDIPFLRLRDRIEEPLLARTEIDFATVVHSVQQALEAPILELRDEGCRVQYGELAFHLAPQHYAMYKVFARAARDARPGAGPDGVGPDHRGWWTSSDFHGPDSEGTRLFLGDLQGLPISSAQSEKVQVTTQLIRNDDPLGRNDMFRRIRAKLKREIEAKVDDIHTRQTVGFAYRGRVPSRFGLTLPADRIRLDDDL